MKYKITTSFLFLIVSLLSITSVSGQNWELKRDKGGIKVYVREQVGSAIRELKFTTTVEASLQTIAAVITHVEGFDDWVYAAVISKTLKKVSDTDIYYYTELDFPWPLSNRDIVLHSIFWQDKKTLALHSKTTSSHWVEKEKEGLVRITKCDIYWTFTPIGKGKVQIDYYLNTDPAGSIPAWMINLAADQGPLQSMIKFKEMLEKERYKNSRLAFVQDTK
ncbi:MAG: hypothetical protein HY842_15160 [Bacteroidetes bacterium]|nr:hypothetical protein [Bacteroidota bacterium]